MIKTNALPLPSTLHKFFEYRPCGSLAWKIKVKGSRAGVGELAGDVGSNIQKNTCKYRKVSVPGFGRFLTHRVVWVMHNGDIPDGKWIDHVNRNKSDNRIENLRLIDWAGNQRNTLPKNKTGLPKHVQKTSTGRYAVMIRIGTYDTADQAAAAALDANKKLKLGE